MEPAWLKKKKEIPSVVTSLYNDARMAGAWIYYVPKRQFYTPKEFIENWESILTKDQFRDWVAANGVNLIVSDLFVLDEGSILTGSVETTKALDGVLGDGLEDLIECHVPPQDVITLSDHAFYWVDLVVRKNTI